VSFGGQKAPTGLKDMAWKQQWMNPFHRRIEKMALVHHQLISYSAQSCLAESNLR
jgi:hypothetical protein